MSINSFNFPHNSTNNKTNICYYFPEIKATAEEKGSVLCTLYIDSFFAANFILDYIAVRLLVHILHIRGKRILILSFGIVLALLPLFAIALKIRGIIRYTLEMVVIITGVFLITGDTRKKLFRNFLLFLCIFLILGGIGELLYNNTVIGYIMQKNYILFLMVLSTVAIIMCEVVYEHREKSRIYKNNIYDVEFENEFCEYRGKALYDSGNTLIDPFFKKGISIVEAGKLKLKGQMFFHLVPYNSLGNSHGLLKVVEVKTLKIRTDDKVYTLDLALIGIYEGRLSSDEYSMILNSTIFDNNGGKNNVD